MAKEFGQIFNDYSGGAFVWDSGLVGDILLQDYFDEPIVENRLYLGTRLESEILVSARSKSVIFVGLVAF